MIISSDIINMQASCKITYSKEYITMANGTITGAYEALPKLVKVILQLFLGALIGGVYRILKFLETKNVVTLVCGILNFVGLGFIFWIIDLITEIAANRISFLAD